MNAASRITPELTEAPFFAALAEAGPEAAAWWVQTTDGTRIRVARLGQGPKGTVLLLPGRTEYIEKYGPAARAFAERGYGCAAIDWRGQGIADRLLPDRAKGHVARMGDYQKDLAALVAALPQMGLSGPRFMVAHSMGGAIGLRAVFNKLDLGAAVFTGPMWGISLGAIQPIARVITGFARMLGLGTRFAPGTSPVGYTQRAPFKGNTLTGDAEIYAWMKSHLDAQPDLSLGGPTLHWLDEALRETALLARHGPPKVPVLTMVGELESIVDHAAIRACAKRWTKTLYETVPGAQHEIMMETPAIREAFFDRAAAFFDAHQPS